MYFLYNILLLIVVILISPFVLVKMVISARWRAGLGERFGFLPPGAKADNSILIWAASVGEVRAAALLVKELNKNFPEAKIVLATMTPEGNRLAKELKLGDRVIFAPLDFFLCVRRVLASIRPKLFVLVETELWPNFIKEAKKSGAKIILVNGRISARSFGKYKAIKDFLKNIFNYFDVISVREPVDKERLIILGAPPDKVVVSGNIKYDQLADDKQALKPSDKSYREFGLKPEALVLVAGSTKENEEEIILKAYRKITEKFTALRLIIAPRHLKRVKEIENILKQQNFEYIKKTDLGKTASVSDKAVILLDTMGELVKAYSLATVAFVGGSLVKTGGQNIMEPASLGKPVIFGPYMESFWETALLLKKTGGAVEIKDGEELAGKVSYFLANPQVRAAKGEELRQAVLSMRGATQRNIELIKKLIG
ncbi:MAG: 3-deoxy-D-manno-octulosonic acid transferase [bacterium]